MKKIINVLVSLALVLSFASCDNLQQNENGGNGQNQNQGVEEKAPGLSITATIEGAKVNGTLVDAEGGKVNVRPHWEVGDRIYGNNNNGTTNLVCYKVVSVKDGVATFWWAGEGEEPKILENTSMSMFYISTLSKAPYVGNNRVKYEVDLSNQDGTLNSAVRNAVMHAVGKVTKETAADGSKRLVMNLDFKNVTSLFKISGLQYSDGTKIPAGTEIFVSADKGFSTNMVAVVNNSLPQFASDNFANRSLKLTTVDEGGVACAYFVQPATEYWNSTSNPKDGIADFSILVPTKDDALYWKSSNPKAKEPKKVEHGKVYNLAKNGTVIHNGIIVDDTEFVFGPGNLQYSKQLVDGVWTDRWRFAPNSYDIVGDDNVKISRIKGGYAFGWDENAPETEDLKYYQGWIDLLGYGATYADGDEKGRKATVPYIAGEPVWNDEVRDYVVRKSLLYYPLGSIKDTQYDWGVCDKIDIEDDDRNDWRLLTKAEWRKIIERSNYGKLAFVSLFKNAEEALDIKAQPVARGMVFVPEVFLDPCLNSADAKTVRYADRKLPENSLILLNKIHTGEGYEINKYTLENWSMMESLGCVFLPAAGERIGYTPGASMPSYDDVEIASMKYTDEQGNYVGLYWCSDDFRGSNPGAPNGCIFSGKAAMGDHIWRVHFGCSVRLVYTIQHNSVTE